MTRYARNNSPTLLFAALTCLVACGLKLDEAIDKTKKYLAKAAVHPFKIGKGQGPLNRTTPF